MTCIVALSDDGNLHFGGDSLISDQWEGWSIRNPKVFQNGEIIFGICGSIRMGQLLQHMLEVPPRVEGQDLWAYLVGDLTAAIQYTFETAKFLEGATADSIAAGGEFIIGYRGGIYIFYEDYSIVEMNDGYAAIGAGASAAMGALYILKDLDLSPKEKIIKSLEASEHSTLSVKKPFFYLEKPTDKEL